MDFLNFIRAMVAGDMAAVAAASLVVAGFVFAVIEGVDALVKRGGSGGLSADFKFWAAIVLSFVVPIASYALVVNQTEETLSTNGVFLAVCVAVATIGYMISQGIHRLVEGRQEDKKAKALASRAAGQPGRDVT